MRILVIGGNGFIGSHLVRELQGSGHEIAVLHRRPAADLVSSGVSSLASSSVVQIEGDRNRLAESEVQLRRFSPDVMVDLILSSGEQARQLMSVARGITGRIVAISSMDVYRAWGVVVGSEPGALEPLPLTEDSPVRTNRRLYPPETIKMMQNVFFLAG